MDETAATGCLGKEAFTGPQLARQVARRKPGRDAYRCASCGLWHVGTTKPSRNRDWRRGRKWVPK